MRDDAGLLPREIQRRLDTRVFARRIYYLPEVDSTNRLAVELARLGEEHGTLVISDYQTMGRGRMKRAWESPRGRNLLFSLVLRPPVAVQSALTATLALSVGIVEALSALTGREVGVKWPNDVVVDGKKICGILSEASSRGRRAAFVVVGMGINVNVTLDEIPEEFRDAACSCRSLSGRKWERRDVLVRVLQSLEAAYDDFVENGFEAVRPRYVSKLTVLGARIRFERAGVSATATAVGLAPDGGLVVETAGRKITLYEDEVSLLRPTGGSHDSRD